MEYLPELNESLGVGSGPGERSCRQESQATSKKINDEERWEGSPPSSGVVFCRYWGGLGDAETNNGMLEDEEFIGRG